MSELHTQQQSQALQNLLAIDDPYDLPRYDHNSEASLKKQHKIILFPQRIGKENLAPRRDVLPKVNSSKHELKMILKRLEDGMRDQNQSLRLKKRACNDSSTHSQTFGLKVLKESRATQNLGPLCKKDSSKGVLDIGAGDDIRTLMRQKNYSTNALNLKTLHILQQLNCKNSRAYSLSVKHNQLKNPKKNMIAFLRRVA